MANPAKNITGTIIKAGLLAGTIDICTAFLHFYIRTGKDPALVLKYVASAVFGKAIAYSGNALMPAWGLIFHYAIAFICTIIFFMACSKIKLLLKNKIVTGLLYGILIWTIMAFLVVPASNAPKIPFNYLQALIAVSIIICTVGLPISLIVNKYYSKQ